jgi:hypothetical protein
LATAGGDARAQFFGYGYYPYGYGGYGWGGWGGTTVQGDIARGLGYFAVGAGEYNRETAIANAINADTLYRWNQYMYLSQLEADRRERLRLLRRQQRDSGAGDLIYQRLRDNPTAGDIANGDALNVMLDQVTDPRIHSSALRMASAPISADVVNNIPFVHASDAVTISLNQLTAKEGWPEALRGENFAPEREAYQQAVAKALEEDKEGAISPQTAQAVRDAASRLAAKLAASPPADPEDRVEAENYVKTLLGMSRMLERPNVDRVIAELEKVKKTSLGSLIGFMHTFNLRFGPATTPRQREVYTELYPLLAAYRDRVFKDSGIADKTPPKPAPERPTDFFKGMHLDHLEGKKSSNTPPPAAK